MLYIVETWEAYALPDCNVRPQAPFISQGHAVLHSTFFATRDKYTHTSVNYSFQETYLIIYLKYIYPELPLFCCLNIYIYICRNKKLIISISQYGKIMFLEITLMNQMGNKLVQNICLYMYMGCITSLLFYGRVLVCRCMAVPHVPAVSYIKTL